MRISFCLASFHLATAAPPRTHDPSTCFLFLSTPYPSVSCFSGRATGCVPSQCSGSRYGRKKTFLCLRTFVVVPPRRLIVRRRDRGTVFREKPHSIWTHILHGVLYSWWKKKGLFSTKSSCGARNSGTLARDTRRRRRKERRREN